MQQVFLDTKMVQEMLTDMSMKKTANILGQDYMVVVVTTPTESKEV